MTSRRRLVLAAVLVAAVLAVWWLQRRRRRRETLDMDVAARVEAGLPLYASAVSESQRAQVMYSNAVKAGKARDTAFHVLVATKARAGSVTSVLFAAIYVRRASAANRDKAGAAAMQVRKFYDAAVAAEQAAKTATATEAARKAAGQAELARVRCQAGLLDVMAVVEQPKPAPQLPPRPVPIEDCDMYNTSGGYVGGDDSRAATPEEKRLITYLQYKGQELLAHMLAKYPKDQHTLTLNTHWSRRVRPMSAEQEASMASAIMVTNGMPYSMCVHVSMGLMCSVPRSLNNLVHELSHIAADTDGDEPHTAKFYSLNRKLMRIASNELGWTLETWCVEACQLRNDPLGSSPAAACPKCIWQVPPDQCVASLDRDPRACDP
jgi:hypothetical protein